MRPTQLSLLVFYKEKEIADPSEFVMNICGLWDSMEFEPLNYIEEPLRLKNKRVFAGGIGFFRKRCTK